MPRPRPGLTDQDLVADGLAVVSLGPFISVINYVHSPVDALEFRSSKDLGL